MNEPLYDQAVVEKIWQESGIGVLNTKKNILAYIDYIKQQSKAGLEENQVMQSAEYIEAQIMAMSEKVKANTIVYLKNELRSKLGKFMNSVPIEDNAFIQFFKQTYPERKRTKAFTFALADLNKLKIEQILDTLKKVNTHCMQVGLSREAQKDILPMIQRVIDTQNVRFINQVKSMEGIRKTFRLKVVEEKGRFRIQQKQ